jgi:DNA-directed RNA polymerase subunit RPC12/RpoP
MPIVFHCEHCGKKIEAQDNAGGKWGKCPACHNKVYVPDLISDADDLILAPIDEQEEKKKKQLMAETFKLQQDILLEKEDASAPSAKALFEIDDKELTKNIVLYLRQMVNGDLADAKNTLSSITPYSQKTLKILDSIAISEMPEPDLADIPPQILAGLIRDLRSKLS